MPSVFAIGYNYSRAQGYQNYRAKVEITVHGTEHTKPHQADNTEGRAGQQTRVKWLDLLHCSQADVHTHLTEGWENVQAGSASTQDSGKCFSGQLLGVVMSPEP